MNADCWYWPHSNGGCRPGFNWVRSTEASPESEIDFSPIEWVWILEYDLFWPRLIKCFSWPWNSNADPATWSLKRRIQLSKLQFWLATSRYWSRPLRIPAACHCVSRYWVFSSRIFAPSCGRWVFWAGDSKPSLSWPLSEGWARELVQRRLFGVRRYLTRVRDSRSSSWMTSFCPSYTCWIWTSVFDGSETASFGVTYSWATVRSDGWACTGTFGSGSKTWELWMAWWIRPRLCRDWVLFEC